jgi:hypothetical protein
LVRVLFVAMKTKSTKEASTIKRDSGDFKRAIQVHPGPMGLGWRYHYTKGNSYLEHFMTLLKTALLSSVYDFWSHLPADHLTTQFRL